MTSVTDSKDLSESLNCVSEKLKGKELQEKEINKKTLFHRGIFSLLRFSRASSLTTNAREAIPISMTLLCSKLIAASR